MTTEITNMNVADNKLNSNGFTTLCDDNEYGNTLSIKVGNTFIKILSDYDLEDGMLEVDLINKATKKSEEFLSSLVKTEKLITENHNLDMDNLSMEQALLFL